MAYDNITDMADVCELAHRRTVDECKRKNIPVDCQADMQDGECVEHDTDETHYGDQSQMIFDGHYDRIIEATGL